MNILQIETSSDQTQANASATAASAAAAAVEDDSVFLQSNEEPKRDTAKSPTVASTTVSGRATPADFEQNKPVTPDFSAITPAQVYVR